jgi:hypothetical protein
VRNARISGFAHDYREVRRQRASVLEPGAKGPVTLTGAELGDN